MKLRCVTIGHMAMDGEWKFRCDGDLVDRFDRIAALMRRDRSDLSRLVFEDFVAQKEAELGVTRAALNDLPGRTIHPPPQPASYTKPKLPGNPFKKKRK